MTQGNPSINTMALMSIDPGKVLEFDILEDGSGMLTVMTEGAPAASVILTGCDMSCLCDLACLVNAEMEDYMAEIDAIGEVECDG